MEKVEPGGILDTEDLVGSEGGNVSGLGLTVDWDTRDSVLFPRRGSFVQVDVDGYSAITEDYAGFFSFRIDARRYVAVGRGVMAIETYFHTNSGDVPFDRLALLGGESLLRGYYKGRFRDKGLLLLQAEYRVFVTKRIGVAGFAGVADVFPGIGEFRVEKLKYALGSGIRYLVNKRDNTTVRVDMAWGQASFGFYVTAREAF
jgi:outer membrane protein assembly factor BamA